MLNQYQVKGKNSNGVDALAYLRPASAEDINANHSRFTCNWRKFWDDADFDCEAILKLETQGELQGLIHIGLYPYPPLNERAEYLEIIALESVVSDCRRITPVGFWLIWYATKASLDFDCVGDKDSSILKLVSVETAIDYYRDKVRMEGQGWITLSPNEDGYAFRFSKEQAIDFCNRMADRYDQPIKC